MSLLARIEKLERLVGGDDGPLGVPEAWIERDEHGNMIGPPADADSRAVVTFLTVLAMDRTVPHRPGCEAEKQQRTTFDRWAAHIDSAMISTASHLPTCRPWQ